MILGALITSGLFTFGKYLIGLHLKYSNFTETYEASGALILILLWVYYSTVILLLGAEITRSIMKYKGQRVQVTAEATKVIVP